jgi:O-antigen ligase
MGAALEKIIVWGLLLLLMASTLAHGTVESWSLALLETGFVVLLLLWGLHCLVTGRVKLVLPALTWPLAGLVLLGLIGSLAWQGKAGTRQSLSWDVEATRLTTLTLIGLFIAFLLFANFLITSRRITLVTQVLLFFGCALALFGLLQYFTWNGKFYWLREPLVPPTDPFGPFVNHNHFAGYVEMLAPLPLAMVWMKSARREHRLLYLSAVVLMDVAVFVSLSRGGMISVLASTIFVLLVGSWMLKRRARQSGESFDQPSGFKAWLSRVAAFVVLLGAIGFGVFWVAADPFMNRLARTQIGGEAEAGRDTIYKSRGFIWQGTLKLIADQPLLGVGLGAYGTAFTQYSVQDSSVFPIVQAHNDYLQILADGGLVGGALAVWFLLLLLRAIWRGVQQPDLRLAAWCLGAGGGLFALLVHSLFDFNLQLPSNALLFLLWAALVSVVGVQPRKPTTSS